jgi:hypothetical protein
MPRLSAPEHTRDELNDLMNGDLGTAKGRGHLVRRALHLLVEEALEGEVSDGLGRERCERGKGEKARGRRRSTDRGIKLDGQTLELLRPRGNRRAPARRKRLGRVTSLRRRPLHRPLARVHRAGPGPGSVGPNTRSSTSAI